MTPRSQHRHVIRSRRRPRRIAHPTPLFDKMDVVHPVQRDDTREFLRNRGLWGILLERGLVLEGNRPEPEELIQIDTVLTERRPRKRLTLIYLLRIAKEYL